jgi:hypothetical protein
LRFLDVRIVLGAGRHQLRHAAALLELRVGHVDAVFAHALGEVEHGLSELRLLLLVERRRADLLEDLPARFLRVLHFLLVAGPLPELEAAVHRVGQVDSVLAHAPGVLELRLLPLLRIGCAGAGAAVTGVPAAGRENHAQRKDKRPDRCCECQLAFHGRPFRPTHW